MKNDNEINLQKFCADVGLQYIKDDKGEYGYYDGLAVMSTRKTDSDIQLNLNGDVIYYSDVSMTKVFHFKNLKSVYNHVFNYPWLKEEIISLIKKYKKACIEIKLKNMEQDFENDL